MRCGLSVLADCSQVYIVVDPNVLKEFSLEPKALTALFPF